RGRKRHGDMRRPGAPVGLRRQRVSGRRNIDAPGRRRRRHPGAAGPARRLAAGSVMAKPRLTHLDEAGAARMVDVSDKDVTSRTATAGASVWMAPETLRVIVEGEARKG